MVPPTSPRIPRVRGYSGSEPSASRFAYKTFTSFGRASHPVRLRYQFFARPLPRQHCCSRFSLFRFRSPLLSESFVYFLFLWVIRCFSSPGSPCITIDSLCNTITLLMVSSLIRISTDLGSFAAPRSFSQLVTSFVGSQCQGILHMLLFA